MKKKFKSKKEVAIPLGNRRVIGTSVVKQLLVKAAAPVEAKRIEQAIDRLLAEWVRQVREPKGDSL